MTVGVSATEDPESVLDLAHDFLVSDPVRHNLILTLLHARIAHPEPGQYWIVGDQHRIAGVVFQSPVGYFATMTPMSAESVVAAADAVVDHGVHLPGVNGEAATVARFAGHWTERTSSAAHPTLGQRVYEVGDVIASAPIPGALRRATVDDGDLLASWFRAFQTETGEAVGDATQIAARRLTAGQLWVWDDRGAVAFAGLSETVAGVARVDPVYTPPDRRSHGYGSALVASISAMVRSNGDRCILYTDLGNPTSNSIYRAIGYRAVSEVLRYEFS
jgi:predicted GNAT family acetyltransferase